MSDPIYDLVVIGGGSGGIAAAKKAAQAGAKTALVEDRQIGGTCVNRGCVPKKLLVHASRMADTFDEAASFGWSVPQPRFDWTHLQKAVNAETQRLSEVHTERLRSTGVDLIAGRGRLGPDGNVVVERRSLSDEQPSTSLNTRHILLATGARPVRPSALPGIEYAITSDELFQLSKLPQRMVIVGGGYIGVEFACLLSRLGVEIALIDSGERLLKGFDADISALMQTEMESQGIEIYTGKRVNAIDRSAKGLSVDIGDQILTADEILLAVGRQPNSNNLGLDSAKVLTDNRGAISVDANYQTSHPKVYAIGDVVGKMALTPVAVREARAVVGKLLGDRDKVLDLTFTPTAVFGTPEASKVGLTEAESLERGFQVETHTTRFRPLGNLLAPSPVYVFMKVVVERKTDRLLGCHFCGPAASEAAQMATLVLQAGLTKRQLDDTMPLHPTVAEELIGL